MTNQSQIQQNIDDLIIKQNQLIIQLDEAHPPILKSQKAQKETAFQKIMHIMQHVPDYTDRTNQLKARLKNLEDRTLKLKYAMLK
ncbi:hypothetical protein SS50377_20701 [Spironucleus salmonicida]|uniref:Uncharacterized protein n=1 Tax=Spironucleus salmonicida TaxID=348837 RepID=V6LZ42_9EUKA|nr:hypothetical protein SS50377_20701 [Spironucleus salmonicida]|eukprot:EST49548.1 Hypothetical protein SS50377_10157 [Spironucleus salmonicida]